VLDRVAQEVSRTYYITTLQPFNDLFYWATWVRWYQKGKTRVDLSEMAVASAGPYANNLHLAPDR